MKLYGEMVEITGEPRLENETLVLVDAIEVRSGKPKTLRIPLPILRMASESRKAA